MQTKKRYNIGLVIGNIEDVFPNQICKGAMEAAEEQDVNLFIFPAKYLDRSEQDRNDPKQQYEYQYNLLLAYARSQSLDGVLLCLSNIGYRSSKARRQKVLDHFNNMPLILVASDEPGYACTKFDNTTGLADGINYLIKRKGCSHIGMINGMVENSDALERFGVYKTTLAENGIEYSDELVGYGDLSNKCADAVNALLDKNPDMDALVCGNDTMAQAAYKVLKERNIAIGKDFFVLGFDDIQESQFMDPPLATVRADAAKLGYDSLVHLKGLLDQGFFSNNNPAVYNHSISPKSRIFTVDTSFILRESAGAVFDNRDEEYDTSSRRAYKARIDKRLRQMIDMNHLMNIANRDMLMFGDSSEQNYERFLEAFALDMVSNTYLLLFNNALVHHYDDDWVTPHHLYLRAYSRNRQVHELPRSAQRLSINKNLFTNEYMPDERKTFTVIDIYSGDTQYGILMCDIPYEYFHYVEMMCYQVSIAIKIMELFAIQEELIKEKELVLEKLANENLLLDDISNKDELTGILNRRGFFRSAEKQLSEMTRDGSRYVLLYADLNYLKQVNDRFGHDDGDFAITSCANVLEKSLGGDGIVGRIGGDEFAAFYKLADGETPDDIRSRINANMGEVNNTSGKPYELTVSVGIFAFNAKPQISLKSLLEQADDLLYEEKHRKPPFVVREVQD
ncbi:diguanylate cyclase domain-containing protein [Agathobacter sp.]